MHRGRHFEIELNPVYAAEARERFDDLESEIRRTLPWVITRVAIARSLDDLRTAFEPLDDGARVFRGVLSCEVLGQAASRPDVRAWICEYIIDSDPGAGARYQLAGAYSKLGAESRRAGRHADAAAYARKGLDAVADLPPRAVTAHLYYNLGVALEGVADLDGAIEAFQDAAEIDELVGCLDEAAQCRGRIELLERRRD